MRKDAVSTKRMPMYLVLVACVVALFLALVYYLFYAPGKTNLVAPASNTQLAAPADGALSIPA